MDAAHAQRPQKTGQRLKSKTAAGGHKSPVPPPSKYRLVTGEFLWSNVGNAKTRVGMAMLGFLESLSKILGAVALPVVRAVLGFWFNDSLKSRELNVKYVEIAVNVLSQPPSEETKSLRLWAINLINEHASVKIDETLRDILINKEALPTSDLTNPKTGFKEVAGRREVDKIIVSDTQNTNTQSELDALDQFKVSYHYLIAADGTVHSLVDENNIAFHTARNNSSSIGIGLTHVSGGTYPETQVAALKALVAQIAERWEIPTSQIYGKEEIDKRKRTDFASIKARVVEGLSR